MVSRDPILSLGGCQGTFIARKERRYRDEDYWSAVVQVKHQIFQSYLGTTDNLTIAFLEKVTRGQKKLALGNETRKQEDRPQEQEP